jgi:hypothetical protein
MEELARCPTRASRAGRISLNRMVELPSTNPAKLFGLYPRKGTLAVGSDADIVVFDPEKKHVISSTTDHSKTDYNLFEGTEVTGCRRSCSFGARCSWRTTSSSPSPVWVSSSRARSSVRSLSRLPPQRSDLGKERGGGQASAPPLSSTARGGRPATATGRGRTTRRGRIHSGNGSPAPALPGSPRRYLPLPNRRHRRAATGSPSR